MPYRLSKTDSTPGETFTVTVKRRGCEILKKIDIERRNKVLHVVNVR